MIKASHANAIGSDAALTNNKNPLTEASVNKAADVILTYGFLCDEKAYAQIDMIYREHEIKLVFFVTQKLRKLHGGIPGDLNAINKLLVEIYAINQEILNSFQELAGNHNLKHYNQSLDDKRDFLNSLKNVCYYGDGKECETVNGRLICDIRKYDISYIGGKFNIFNYFCTSMIDLYDESLREQLSEMMKEIKIFVEEGETLVNEPFTVKELECKMLAQMKVSG